MIRILKELIIRYFPFDIPFKRLLLKRKYFTPVRFKGKNLELQSNVKIIRSNGLVLGSNILIKGGGKIDASAGIMIGDNCEIGRNTNILTKEIKAGITRYRPIVIGAGNKTAGTILPGTILPNSDFTKGLSSHKGGLVFVLSTGRSGSKAIVHLLNQHPQTAFYHDSFPHINTWACDFMYNRRTYDDIKERLLVLYNAIEVDSSKIHGQSDHKLVSLVPILSEIFPEAKFIWLIRRGDSFLSSSYPRGWFDNSEFGYPPNLKEFFPKKMTPKPFHAAHRANGYLLGEMSEEKWKEMTRFERNCWYWTYWNSLIEKYLNELPKEKWMQIKLEELSKKHAAIFKFLNLEPIKYSASQKVNEATYKKLSKNQWTEEMIKVFNFHCKTSMDKWYKINS